MSFFYLCLLCANVVSRAGGALLNLMIDKGLFASKAFSDSLFFPFVQNIASVSIFLLCPIYLSINLSIKVDVCLKNGFNVEYVHISDGEQRNRSVLSENIFRNNEEVVDHLIKQGIFSFLILQLFLHRFLHTSITRCIS